MTCHARYSKRTLRVWDQETQCWVDLALKPSNEEALPGRIYWYETCRDGSSPPAGMASDCDHTGVRCERVDDTVWPVIDSDPEHGGPEWNLRYGSQERDHRMFLASIVAAYDWLTDPACPQGEAVVALRRARAARVKHRVDDPRDER